MKLVIVRWQIHRDDEQTFIESWTKHFVPLNDGLMREFLTMIDPQAPTRLRTLPLEDPEFVTFITVGLWTNLAAFEKAIGRYRRTAAYRFRYRALDRMALELVADRCGDATLPAPSLP